MSSDLDAAIAALAPTLQRFALRATRDVEVARDLSHEALAAALADAKRFERRSTLRTWVLGILAHKLLDHYRARQLPLDGEAEAALLDTASPEDVERTAMARQELGRVEVAVGKLPARERLALLLTDVEGVPRDVVCHDLGVTETHLRVILHRARNRLRRLL